MNSTNSNDSTTNYNGRADCVSVDSRPVRVRDWRQGTLFSGCVSYGGQVVTI